MSEAHPATKKEILSSIPGAINKGLVGLAFASMDINNKFSYVLEEAYVRPSEQTRSYNYAARASEVLVGRGVECPPALQDIIDHRGSTEEFATVTSRV